LAIELQNEPFTGSRISDLENKACRMAGIKGEETKYYVFTGTIFKPGRMLRKHRMSKFSSQSGETASIQSVSDMFDHKFLSERIIKYFLCYPERIQIIKSIDNGIYSSSNSRFS